VDDTSLLEQVDDWLGPDLATTRCAWTTMTRQHRYWR
jgi:hypothetical protein